MSDQQQIADGERLAAFLRDPAVETALKKLEESYVASWKSCTSVTERESLHAKASVLDDLRNELQTVVANGKRAKLDAERRERAAQPPRRR